MTPQPPRLPVWLLTHRLADEWVDFVIGDLEEEFTRRARVSLASARTWYWRASLRCLIAPPPLSRHTEQLRASPPAGDPLVRTLLADLAYSVRVLLRAPSFSVAVIAVVALGIGANTAIFSIVNTVLLRPLPYSESARLVRIFHTPPAATFPGIRRFSVSPANFYDWQREATRFEKMAIYQFRPFTMPAGGGADALLGGAVGDGFFDIIGTPPALGRAFRADEDLPGRNRVVVLSDGFWRTRFAADRGIVGRTVTLSDEAYTIVGVMPARFSMKTWTVGAVDLWVPVAYTDQQRAVRDNHNAQVVARLKPDVDLATANAELAAVSARLEAAYPQANAGWGAIAIPLQEVLVGDARAPLLILLAAVGLVLLIACANVGNLLYARALGRRKELAIRAALGAGRGRVFQQLLVETLVLACVGGAAGVVLAHLSLQAGASILAANQVPRADEIAIDRSVLGFALALSLLTGILAGSVPALRAGRADLNDALKEGGRSDAATIGVRTRRMLIACEVALSVMLLMGAGLMLRTLSALRSVDAGYDAANVLTMTTRLPATRYKTPTQISSYYRTALNKVRALPGVESAGTIDNLPAQGGSVQPIVLDGRAELLPRDQPTVGVRKITPGYLQTMRISLLRGRDVVASDIDTMLVSKSAAKLLFGERDPIGTRVTLPLESKTRQSTIVGIVGDVKQSELSAAAGPTVYEFTQEHDWRGMNFAIRTVVPPLSIAPAAAAALRSIDAEQPIEQVRTMQAIVDETLTSQRFSALLLGIFAGLALALASVGIFSVLSYIVRGRSREIGIRTALGAAATDVVRLVIVEGMTPALAGIVAGAIGVIASAKLLQKVLYGVSGSDPFTLAAVAMTLALVALAASLVPAYRACRLDPLDVLRAE